MTQLTGSHTSMNDCAGTVSRTLPEVKAVVLPGLRVRVPETSFTAVDVKRTSIESV